MAPLSIITGTISLRVSSLGLKLSKKTLHTPYGDATILYSDRLILLPRHGTDKRNVIPPHRINHLANLYALKIMGAHDVVGLNSTGSLRKDLPPRTLIVPDDFISLAFGPTIFEDHAHHILPALSSKVRDKILRAAAACGQSVHNRGIYWQTEGPRLETRAEIRLMSQFADLVGMTMAGEAVAACEIGLRYASLCSVDNFANGIIKEAPAMKTIQRYANRNARIIQKIVVQYIEMYGKN